MDSVSGFEVNGPECRRTGELRGEGVFALDVARGGGRPRLGVGVEDQPGEGHLLGSSEILQWRERDEQKLEKRDHHGGASAPYIR